LPWLKPNINKIITQQSNTTNNTNPITIKESQPIGCARLNIMPPTNNLRFNYFKMVQDMGLKITASRSP
jgi:hypothetical protein